MSDFNFQAGQQVAVIFHHWDRHITGFMTVDRVTATLAIVGTSRYNRKDGFQVGKYASRSNRIEPATPEIIAEYAAHERKRSRTQFLRRILDGNWQSMGEENLDKVAAVLGFERGESEGKETK